MKHLLIILTLAAAWSACQSSAKEKSIESPVIVETLSDTTSIIETEPYKNLYGTYVGAFDDLYGDSAELPDNYVRDFTVKVSLNINRITDSVAFAKSIVKGLGRPMYGTMKVIGNQFSFDMKEPGDHDHDGRFIFTIENDTLRGTWSPYKKNLNEKVFTLVKKPFDYNPKLMLPNMWDYIDWENQKIKTTYWKNDDGTIDTLINEVYRSASPQMTKINASTTLLKESQLKNLKKLDLEILRNSIFARHGYAFKSKNVRQFFDQIDWYTPISEDVTADLTDIEKANITLLKRFEKYAKDNYDNFGR